MHCLSFCVAKGMHLCRSDWSRAAVAIPRKVYTEGALASRVKLHKFRQILMHCAVIPGGERENGNQATLLRSGEGIRRHSLDKASH
jgi:hypothetical protein